MNMQNSKPKPEAKESTKIWKKSSLGDSWFSIYWKNSTFKVRSLTSSGRLYGENYFQNFYALNKMLEIKSFQTT